MKKLKKFGKSSFAVVLSLVLCAGMVVPAFAASFSELQDVINNQSSLVNQETNEVRIGYDNGNVTLHENVTHETGESKLTISGADTNITLDLNGNTIDGNGEVGVIWVKDSASLTLEAIYDFVKLLSLLGGIMKRQRADTFLHNRPSSFIVFVTVSVGNIAKLRAFIIL